MPKPKTRKLTKQRNQKLPDSRQGRETREKKFALIDRIRSVRASGNAFKATGNIHRRVSRVFHSNTDVKGAEKLGSVTVDEKTRNYYIDRRSKKGTATDRKNK